MLYGSRKFQGRFVSFGEISENEQVSYGRGPSL